MVLSNRCSSAEKEEYILTQDIFLGSIGYYEVINPDEQVRVHSSAKPEHGTSVSGTHQLVQLVEGRPGMAWISSSLVTPSPPHIASALAIVSMLWQCYIWHCEIIMFDFFSCLSNFMKGQDVSFLPK